MRIQYVGGSDIVCMLYTKQCRKTPYELWKGFEPNLQAGWGCLEKAGLPDFKVANVWTKTYDCVFIGYA